MNPPTKAILHLALAMAAAPWSQAAVTYVNPEPDIVIPTTFGGIYLDLITGTGTPSSPSGGQDPGGTSYTTSYSEPPAGNWDVNFFFGGAGIAHYSTFQPYRANPTDNLSAIHNQIGGTTIDGSPVTPEPATGPSAPLTVPDFGGSGSGSGGGGGISTSGDHMGTDANQFANGARGYMAFVLAAGTPDQQFGWIGLTLYNDGTPGIIHDWAYSPDPIDVGAIPEPATAALLALAGLSLLRRRR